MSKSISTSEAAVDFEQECWEVARVAFRSRVRKDDIAKAEQFLKSNDSPKDAANACKKTDQETAARYATDKSFSFTIAGKKVVPKAIFVKLLNNLDVFVAMGDVAVKGGPESVGLVWMGLKMGLRMIDADLETCGVISACFADIVGIFISCRLFCRLYSPSAEGVTEVQDQLRGDIPDMLLDILEFSFSAAKFSDQSELKRWAKGFVKDSKFKYESKAKTIREHHEKLLKHAHQAFQEEITAHSRVVMAGTKDLLAKSDETAAKLDEQTEYMKKVLGQLQGQIEEDRKNLRNKTFEEVQREAFHQNCSKLNESVDVGALHRRNLGNREEGTCRWIFDLASFKEWRDADSTQTIWISGEAGFGKSTLLSTIIEDLSQDLKDDGDRAVHYFFCRNGNDSTQTARKILANILFQMYKTSSASISRLEKANNVFREADSPKEGIDEALGDLYITMGEQNEKTVFLLVDALDECNDDLSWLSSKLHDMVDKAKFRLKVLVSSRTDAHTSEAIGKWQHEVRMKDHNGPDIERKVKRGLAQIPGLSTDEQRIACEMITKKAEGEFSLVNIAVDILRQPWRRTVTGQPRTISQVLEELPHGTHGSYELAFAQVNEVYVELAKTCLQWCLLTEGEITVTEIMDAYNGVYLNQDYVGPKSATEMDESQQKTLTEQIERACSAFLEIDKQTSPWTIKLRHASVKDHFLQENQATVHKHDDSDKMTQCTKCGSHVASSPPFFVYEKEGHLTLAITILQHLNSPGFQRQFALIDEDTDDDSENSENEAAKSDEDAPTEASSATSVEDNSEETVKPDTEPVEAGLAQQQGEVTEVAPGTDSTTDEVALEGQNSAEELPSTDAAAATPESEGDEPRPGLVRQPTSGSTLTEEVDTVGPFVDDEDDTEEAENDYPSYWTPPPPERVRYEISHWVYHVRQAEKLWPAEEREGNPQWKTLCDLFEEFVNSKAGLRWWNVASNTTLKFWYRGDQVTPLHIPVGLGLTAMTAELLKRGCQVNMPSQYGETALHFAVKLMEPNDAIIKMLLENDREPANPNFIAAENAASNEEPAFFRLLQYRPEKESIELFIQKGASCAEPYEEELPLHRFAWYGSDPEALDLLLSNGADINAGDKWGETPLHKLLKREDVPVELLRAMLKSGADLSIEDRRSQQPLYEVSEYGNTDALDVILENNPDLEDRDILGMSAMHVAAYYGHDGTIERLKKAGADINPRDLHGRTPLMFACLGKHDKTALVILDALEGTDFDEINVPDKDGRTPLRKAARHGLTETLTRLLDLMPSNAVLEATDSKSQRTALQVAAFNGQCEAVELLLRKYDGSDAKHADVLKALSLCHDGWERGARDVSEKTMLALLEACSQDTVRDPALLCTAARMGSLDVIKALVDRGSDVNAKDNHGWSALATARQFEQVKAATLLAEKGAEITTRPTQWTDPDERLQLAEDGLTVKFIGEDNLHACILADHPVPATHNRYYYEIELLKTDQPVDQPEVGLGFATRHTKLVGKMPGWAGKRPVWGYHCDDGMLYGYNADGKSLEDYKPWTYGQTVGCGVDFNEKSIFYTVDGERLSTAFEPVRGQLFPIVGTGSQVSVKANFGKDLNNCPFKWSEAESFCNEQLHA